MILLNDLWNNEVFLSGFTENIKHGYWFTVVVFFYFVLFAAMGYVCDRIKTKLSIKATVYVVVALAIALSSHIFVELMDTDISCAFSYPLIAEYIPYYCFGLLSRMYYDTFMRVITDSRLVSAFLVIFVVVYNIDFIPHTPCCITAILVINAFFFHYKGFFSLDTKVGVCLSYIGKNTLSIYFLHYFVFKYMNLHWLATFIMDNNVQFIGVLLTIFLSLVIIALCLLVERGLRVAKPLHAIMFGPQAG